MKPAELNTLKRSIQDYLSTIDVRNEDTEHLHKQLSDIEFELTGRQTFLVGENLALVEKVQDQSPRLGIELCAQLFAGRIYSNYK